jgi:two-component system response regulator RegX3
VCPVGGLVGHIREQAVNDRPTPGYRGRRTLTAMTGEQRNGAGAQRATWLVLAVDGPGLELPKAAPDGPRVRTIADPATFLAIFDTDRPRIAILAEPPAGPNDRAAVAQERRRRQSLRTIHLSRPDDVAARLAALREGFDEALPHSIGAVELAARAAILEDRTRVRSASCLRIADGYELDLVAHELRHDGRAVHLRPKEFQLLAMLAAHPGRAYTRRQLLDRVWGPDQVGDPRTVDVHVRWLRSKIEAQPDRPIHLVTVRGVGYRLDPPLTEP